MPATSVGSPDSHLNRLISQEAVVNASESGNIINIGEYKSNFSPGNIE